MNSPTIVILGGYGRTGSAIARLLLQHTEANLVIAGRNGFRIDSLCRQLNHAFPGGRVNGVRADAAVASSLNQAFLGANLVVVASSTARYADRVALACLEANCDYIDVQYSAEKIAALKALGPEIERQHRCFLTDAGFHPGVPAALVRFVAPFFDRLTSATVASILNPQGGLPCTGGADELVHEMGEFRSVFFRNGVWQKTRWNHSEDLPKVAFEAPFGEKVCTPMFLEEMAYLPERFPSLRETGFAIAGFNPVTDYLVLPLIYAGAKILPGATHALAGALAWSTRTFDQPPFGNVLHLEAHGEREGLRESATLTLFHHDAYQFTAIPVVATILQWQREPHRVGLFLAAHFVEPTPFLKDMERFGLRISGSHWVGSRK
ncbi:MAG: saccharopine dehydrogenase NADP-binding domain-containing protein [Capsulimonadales bacterium]|nr:saccharopine dehydrogenase NADP-binding domain-containing protein [Capsulimonadales bacterium]